jgi:hypothetical protein
MCPVFRDRFKKKVLVGHKQRHGSGAARSTRRVVSNGLMNATCRRVRARCLPRHVVDVVCVVWSVSGPATTTPTALARVATRRKCDCSKLSWSVGVKPKSLNHWEPGPNNPFLRGEAPIIS